MNAIDTAVPKATLGRELLIAALLAFYTFFGEFFLRGGVGLKQVFLISIALLYMLSFLWPRREQAGSVVLFLGALGLYLLTMVFFPAFIDFVLVLAGTISLVRILAIHRSLVCAIADASLCAAGLIAATVAYVIIGEFSAAIWSFFLLQSLYPLITPVAHFVASTLGGYVRVPAGLFPPEAGSFGGGGLKESTVARVDRFKKALRSAEEALHSMETR